MVDDLITSARDALECAYTPYSEYPVGAALETNDGTVFTGCNIENANYSNTVHAEGLALSKAVEAGHRSFERIAVSSERRDGVTPCGLCRQSLSEFCGPELRILCDGADGTTTYTLGELLPNTITGQHLE